MDLVRDDISGNWQRPAPSPGQNNREDSITTNIIGEGARVSTTRQPSQRQLSRRVSSMSDSVDLTDTQAQFQGRALLEEWPRRESLMDLDDLSIGSSRSYKEVSFATYSSLHVFPSHEIERRKSYTSSEIKEFRTQVSLDAFRVKELIATCPYERGHAIRHLICVNALAPEELIGIDHLVCDDCAAQKIAHERFVHMTMVIKKQHELQAGELADLAGKRSAKSSKKALIRARLAELQETDTSAKEHCELQGVNTVRGLKDTMKSRRKAAVAA
eukprot:CCRYP_014058-RA/>CCRYP_014058-RA protein AED:0.17 eAED:0.17 QI:0/-1/0/1/-1/1/1/0/271